MIMCTSKMQKNPYENVIAVTNRSLCQRPFAEQIERVCSLHPKAVILREKDLPEEEYSRLAEQILDWRFLAVLYSAFGVLTVFR